MDLGCKISTTANHRGPLPRRLRTHLPVGVHHGDEPVLDEHICTELLVVVDDHATLQGHQAAV